MRPSTLRLPSTSGSGTTPTRVRIERRGVTCADARRLISTYLRRATPRNCVGHGTRCILTLPGGWSCSYISTGEGADEDGAFLGCAHSQTRRFLVVPVAAAPNLGGLRAATAPGVACAMSPVHGVLCVNKSSSHNDSARLAAGGELDVCRSTVRGDAGGCLTPGTIKAPTVRAGRSVTVGPFRCTVVAAGVRCVVTASGKGFAMTAADVTAIGGATLVPSPT